VKYQCREPRYDVQTPRFDFGDETERKQGLDFLSEHGYVIVKSVLTAAELETSKELFWDFMENLPQRMSTSRAGRVAEVWSQKLGVRRSDPRSWEKQNGWIAWRKNGIISDAGFGQSPFLWYIRSRPRVKQAFSAVWNTSDLITSFDGGNAFRPWQLQFDWMTQGGWFHVDQNASLLPDRACVQGLVSILDTTPEVGGLTVIPGSHHHFRRIGGELQRAQRLPQGHFVEIPDALLDSLHVEPVVLLCQAGDLCLWDSRTIHCNSPAEPARVAAHLRTLYSTRRVDKKEVPYPSHVAAARSEEEIKSSAREQREFPCSASAGNSGIAAAAAAQKKSDSSPLDLAQALAQEIKLKKSASRVSTPSGQVYYELKGQRFLDAACSQPFTSAAQLEGVNSGAQWDEQALQKLASQPWALIRLVGYVCMTPAAFATPEVLRQRRRAVIDNVTSTHWPHVFTPTCMPSPPFAHNPFLDMALVVGNNYFTDDGNKLQ